MVILLKIAIAAKFVLVNFMVDRPASNRSDTITTCLPLAREMGNSRSEDNSNKDHDLPCPINGSDQLVL